jgi:hypothetical protein
VICEHERQSFDWRQSFRSAVRQEACRRAVSQVGSPSLASIESLIEDVLTEVKFKSQAATDENKAAYDIGHKPLVLEGPRQVILHFPQTSNKLDPCWHGPFTATQEISDNVYQVSDPVMNRLNKVHIAHIRQFDDSRVIETEVLKTLQVQFQHLAGLARGTRCKTLHHIYVMSVILNGIHMVFLHVNI